MRHLFFIFLFFISCASSGIKFNSETNRGEISYSNNVNENNRLSAIKKIENYCQPFHLIEETVTYYYPNDSINKPFGSESDLNIFLRIMQPPSVRSYTTIRFQCENN